MENTFLHKKTLALNQNKDRHFTKHIQSQVYSEIIKSNDKWTDEMFPPCDESLYNGKTEFSNSQGVGLPQFLKVHLSLLIILIKFRIQPRVNLSLSILSVTNPKNTYGKD